MPGPPADAFMKILVDKSLLVCTTHPFGEAKHHLATVSKLTSTIKQCHKTPIGSDIYCSISIRALDGFILQVSHTLVTQHYSFCHGDGKLLIADNCYP